LYQQYFLFAALWYIQIMSMKSGQGKQAGMRQVRAWYVGSHLIQTLRAFSILSSM
jgi:hypothetical protein